MVVQSWAKSIPTQQAQSVRPNLSKERVNIAVLTKQETFQVFDLIRMLPRYLRFQTLCTSCIQVCSILFESNSLSSFAHHSCRREAWSHLTPFGAGPGSILDPLMPDGVRDVMVLGWDVNRDGRSYWIVRDTIGTCYGDQGTFKIEMGINAGNFEG